MLEIILVELKLKKSEMQSRANSRNNKRTALGKFCPYIKWITCTHSLAKGALQFPVHYCWPLPAATDCIAGPKENRKQKPLHVIRGRLCFPFIWVLIFVKSHKEAPMLKVRTYLVGEAGTRDREERFPAGFQIYREDRERRTWMPQSRIHRQFEGEEERQKRMG